MNATHDRAKSIFLSAAEIASPEERRAFVEAQCAGDDSLRGEVDELLRHQQSLGSFLEAPAVAVDVGHTVLYDEPLAERPGTVIGPYKLLQQIGEGGMGVVFMAEQTEPLQRTVALKIIKPGMDTRQVIARFEAERQALALMDHPNIARVIDAATTDTGRPYFVMELVKGQPITEYCDEHHLTPRERLDLFLPVCQAIQHAHQKGIIHRDIKPSNILVAEYDQRPVPKVIDFGVAKAISQPLTERSVFTEYGQIVGTLEYMSPEQAKLNQLDVDTRTDIYSLGVLLYELLTGETPFDKQRLRSAAFDEMLRIIREEEPPRPSTRLSSSDALPSIAANRGLEPLKLNRLVQGELDWIVMKALEKDRARRYETASKFAEDVQHYLNDEAVEVGPPSAAYRFRKFARRNKGPVMAASVILLTLIAGMLGTTIGLIRAEKARQTAEAREAETRAILDFLQDKVFAAAGPEGQDGGPGRGVTLRQAVEAALPFIEASFPNQPSIEANVRMTLGITFSNMGEAGKAAEQYQKARMLHELTLALRKAKLGPDHPDTLRSMNDLAMSYWYLGRNAEALKLYEETLALRKAKLGPDHPDTLSSMHSLASIYNNLRRFAEAVKLFEETVALQKTKLGADHPDTLRSMNGLATSMNNFGRYAEALKLFEETLAPLKAKFGPDHPDTLESMKGQAMSMNNLALSMNNLAWALATCADPAARNTGRALELAKKVVALAPVEGTFWNTLGVAQYRAGDWQSTVETLGKSMKLRDGGDAFDWFFLAMAHWQFGHKDEARKWYEQAVEWMGKNNPDSEELHRFRAEAEAVIGIEAASEERKNETDGIPAPTDAQRQADEVTAENGPLKTD